MARDTVVILRKSRLTPKTILLAAIASLVVVYICVLNANILIKTAKIDSLESNIISANNDYSKLQTSFLSYQNYVSSLESAIDTFDSRERSLLAVINDLDREINEIVSFNTELETQYDNLYSQYSLLKDREELYDKYEYVVMIDGKRTDMSYDNIKLSEELMKNYGYDPHILFGVFGVESGYDPSAKNKRSSATGLGQFIQSSGKYVYEDILNMGKYNHNMAYDPETNIRMSAGYINWLMAKNNGDLFSSIKEYSGRNNLGTYKYLNRMNEKYQGKVDIYDIMKQ